MCTSVQYLSKCTTEAWKWKCLRGVCWSTVLFCTSHLHALMRCLCDSDSCDEGGSDQQIFITQKSSAVRKQAGHVTVSPCPPCSSAPVSTAAAHRHKVSYLALVCVLRRCMVHVCLSVCLSTCLSVWTLSITRGLYVSSPTVQEARASDLLKLASSVHLERGSFTFLSPFSVRTELETLKGLK